MNLEEATLKVNGKDLQAIYAGLDELPGKFGREVYNKMSAQVQAQLDAHEKAQREPAKNKTAK